MFPPLCSPPELTHFLAASLLLLLSLQTPFHSGRHWVGSRPGARIKLFRYISETGESKGSVVPAIAAEKATHIQHKTCAVPPFVASH